MLIDSAPETAPGPPVGFQHDAYVYSSVEEYLGPAVPFVRDGLTAGAAVYAVLPEAGTTRLLTALGPELANQVGFVDMAAAGGNPARLIPFLRDLLGKHPEQSVRVISEPAYPARTEAERYEVILHEALLPLAFEDARSFRLRCPYDAELALDPAPYHVAARPGRYEASLAEAEKMFRTALPGVPDRAARWDFALNELGQVRHWVNAHAAAHGVSRDRLDDLSLALHEICTNSIRFGGGRGRLSVWIADGALICDVSDRGRIDDLLVGRVLPPLDGLGGRGVWLANQLCDLVQLRSGEDFTQVRLSTRLR